MPNTNNNGIITISQDHLFPVNMAYGVRMGYPELIDYINGRMKHLKKQGVYEELYIKYFYTHSLEYYSSQRKNIILYVLIAILTICACIVIQRKIIKRLRVRLGDEESFAMKIFSVSKLFVWIIRSDKVVAKLSPAAQKITGLKACSVLGRRLENIEVCGSDCQKVFDMLFKGSGSSSNSSSGNSNSGNSNSGNSNSGIGNSGSSSNSGNSGGSSNINSGSSGNNSGNSGSGNNCSSNSNSSNSGNSNSSNSGNSGGSGSSNSNSGNSSNSGNGNSGGSGSGIDNNEEGTSAGYDSFTMLGEIKFEENEFAEKTYLFYKVQIHRKKNKTCRMNIFSKMNMFSKINIFRKMNILGKRSLFSKINIFTRKYKSSKMKIRSKINNFTATNADGKRKNKQKFDVYVGFDITERADYEQRLKGSLEELELMYGQLEATYEELAAAEEEVKSQLVELSENQEQLAASERRLHHIVYHDMLTDLPARISFEEILGMYIREGYTENGLYVIHMDVDNFKLINDTMSYAAGDKVLIEISKRLSVIVSGERGVLFRFGGDEFTIISCLKEDTMLQLVKDIIDSFGDSGEPIILKHGSIYISLSIGIAAYPSDGSTPLEIMKNAEIALYRAKEAGRNRYVIYESHMSEAIRQKMECGNHLRTALSNNEFVLHYQPQFDISSNRIIGFEALIRWQNPELGMVSPLKFIKAAEETGYIVPIGRWILSEACSFMKKLHDKGHKDLIIAVNVSVVQLLEQRFVEM